MTRRAADTLAGHEALSAELTIDLDAIVANWRALGALGGEGTVTAGVVKGDAYGCGATRVGPALARAGCETFFVAVPGEAVRLRDALGLGPRIYVLGGYAPAEDAAYRHHALRPVLNSAAQARAWFEGHPGAPAAIQVDTGMNRLGMEASELASLGPLPESIDFLMSHMGCADDPDDPMNAAQLAEFRRVTEPFGLPRSLAQTAGILLGPDYRFELMRPGVGLYGGMPFRDARPVVTLRAPVIQIREVAEGEGVGYGAAWRARRPSRIATLSAGYADGLIRAMGKGCTAFINDTPCPFAGRVSMDVITLDVTDCPCRPGDMAEILGARQTVDDLAEAAGTIPHEILTSLGTRYTRRYTGG